MKAVVLALAFLGVVFLGLEGKAQEEKDTPSQKTKEAIEKFKKAPSLVGQGVRALRERTEATLQDITAAKAPPKKDADLLTLPGRRPEPPESPKYDPAGKRDPFQPFGLRPARPAKAARDPRTLSPLERHEVGQLKLVGIVWDIKEPRAMVEDGAGLGYIVKIGTPIGPNEGKVKAIRPTEIVIDEVHVDFFGARKKRETVMKLPAD